MSADECKAAIEKLKADGKIAKYTLNPGEKGVLKLDLSNSGIVDLTPLIASAVDVTTDLGKLGEVATWLIILNPAVEHSKKTRLD